MSEDVPVMTVTELKGRLDSGDVPVLVDVREPYEADLADLPDVGQLRIPMAEITERLGELDREAQLVLYCRSGARSDRAVRFLIRQGYSNVFNLKGGVLAWGREIDPDVAPY